ncbi:hypothetical protein [Spirillospora sp. NPDC047279]|uniref:hypothetical protein n=1 Tax=Spirillospora sp. NPDC047279 TaxID=3155478 RepID=UPI003406237A
MPDEHPVPETLAGLWTSPGGSSLTRALVPLRDHEVPATVRVLLGALLDDRPADEGRADA